MPERLRGAQISTPWCAGGCSALCPLPSVQCFALGGQLWLGCSPCLSISYFGAPPWEILQERGAFLGGERDFCCLSDGSNSITCNVLMWKRLHRALPEGAGAEPKNQRDAPSPPI